MSLPVTSVLAFVMAGWFLVLSARVIVVRRRDRVSLGDGGNKMLNRRIRAQGNFAEYAPLGIILSALAEVQGANVLALGVLAGMLAVGRLMHGYALSFAGVSTVGRTGGMVLTLIAIALLALMALWAGLAG